MISANKARDGEITRTLQSQHFALRLFQRYKYWLRLLEIYWYLKGVTVSLHNHFKRFGMKLVWKCQRGNLLRWILRSAVYAKRDCRKICNLFLGYHRCPSPQTKAPFSTIWTDKWGRDKECERILMPAEILRDGSRKRVGKLLCPRKRCRISP